MWDAYLDNVAVVVNNLRMMLDCDVILGGYVGRYMDAELAGLRRRAAFRNTFEPDAGYLKACAYKKEAAALGSAILFNLGSSTGGTDIAAMILKKYTGVDVGRALLYSDVLIAASALFVFGITAGLCSLLGLVLKSVLVDNVIESLNRRKAFIIVTAHPEIACSYITDNLVRGATLWDAEGAYTHQEHHIVLTVLSRSQAVLLRRHLKAQDPQAFMIVTNSSEIFGKGFLRA